MNHSLSLSALKDGKTPSDEEQSLRFLCEQYRSSLLNSHYAPLRALICRIDEATQKVVVSGELPTFYLKQQAQELLVRTFGIKSFSNAIRVEEY